MVTQMKMESYILSIAMQKRVSLNITNLLAIRDTRLLQRAKERRSQVMNLQILSTGITMEPYLENHFGPLEDMKDPNQYIFRIQESRQNTEKDERK